MGYILVEAIQSALRQHLPAGLDAVTLRLMAENLSAGKGASALPAGVAKLALAQGFGAVMLYGGVAACLFAVASWLVFGTGRTDALRSGRL
jgi:hypothetical protein